MLLVCNQPAETLSPDAPADLVLWRASSAAEIPYRLPAPIIEGVWKAGERVM